MAEELTRQMSEDGRGPLVIYCIANGHAVSHQNKGRVIGFLGDSQSKAATGGAAIKVRGRIASPGMFPDAEHCPI